MAPTPARADRDHHPSRARGRPRTRERPATTVTVPRDDADAILDIDGRRVKLTNLSKVFWPEIDVTKGDLLQYYADVAPLLLPHLVDRAMVMKRYPNGATGDFFFMKRAPTSRPEWIETCSIEHASGNVIDFPMVQDLASLLWVVNLGCIDLNQWYARCDDVDRPDVLHFDLDPGAGAGWEQVVEAAHVVHEALAALGMPDFVKTTGSRGIHVYVPIVRGPTQKTVWEVAQVLSTDLARRRPDLLTAVYARAKRPRGRVLVDYNQNAWGRTLASVYSVRPTPRASVSTPVTWDELARGVRLDDFRIDTVRPRLARVGDLWAGVLDATGRVDLAGLVSPPARRAGARRRGGETATSRRSPRSR
jgi:bifunctional non-homologous end joining protein LigD